MSEQRAENKRWAQGNRQEHSGTIEKRYPDRFEQYTVHLALSSEAGNDRWKTEIRQLLGIGWDTEETTLFLKLNHSSAEVRVSAVESMVAAVLAGQVRNLSFAVSTLTEKLTDSSPSVVLEVLKLEDKLLELVPAEQQFSLLIKSLASGPYHLIQWQPVRIGVIRLLCDEKFVENLNEEQKIDLFLALLPFLLPKDPSYLKAVEAVVDSYFGRQSPMLRAIAAQLADLRELEEDDRRLPDRIYNLLEQDAPFESEDMNVRLLERIVDDMGRPVTRPFFLRCN